ncbi:PAC2 family-domain-containing protein [Blastocladiella britannica]|nr:PAC2 family-domain-containing protein [Blastocladiella britannica]
MTELTATATPSAPLAASFDTSVLRGAVVILPTVSTGNVPQLAADLLVSSLAEPGAPSMVRLGELFSPYVLSVCGPDAFGVSGRACMPIEVYYSAHRHLAIVQMRAPVIAGYGSAFAESFYALAAATGVAQVLLLSSADAAYRTDALMDSTPAFRHLALGSNAKSLDLSPAAVPVLEDQFHDGRLKGTGYLPALLAAARTHEHAMATDLVLVVTLEGDNLPDTMLLFARLAAVLEATQKGVAPIRALLPVSWAELYGGGVTDELLRAVY